MNSLDLHDPEFNDLNKPHKNGEKLQDSIDETKIWEDFKSGNEDALVYIYRTYADVLFKYGQQFSRDKELLKDALQELFLELIKNRKNLSSTTSIKFYLFKSFRRKIAKKTNNLLSKQDSIENHINNLVVNLSPETIYIQDQMDQEQKLLLSKAIEQLTPMQKEAVCLYFFEGFSYAKIAEIFEFSNIKSVRNLIYRAIEEMTSFVKKSGFGFEMILLSLLVIF